MKRMVYMILVCMFFLILTGENVLAAAENNSLYLWNEEGLYIPIYSSFENCRDNLPTRSYLLNGFPLERALLQNDDEEITGIVLDDSVFYFKSAYISDALPDVFNGKNAVTVYYKPYTWQDVYRELSGHDVPAIPNISDPMILEAARTNIPEIVVELYGFTDWKLITFEEQEIRLIEPPTTMVMTDESAVPPIGMISKEEAIEIAQKMLEEAYPAFDRANLKVYCSFVYKIAQPESSYHLVCFFPEDDRHDSYYVYMDAIHGTINSYGFAEESYG